MEAAAQTAPYSNQPNLTTYVELRIPETNLTVRLEMGAMERLSREVMEGFKKVPRRGLEVGGVLLGSVKPDCTTIEDFEPLPCEHQKGPSFLLSDNDRRGLAEAVARHNAEEPHIVGLYRSQTRAGLAPGDEDLALMAEHCDSPGSVLLLVKPQAGQASQAALYAGGGALEKPVEFPLHRGELAAHGQTLVHVPAAAPAPAPAVERVAPVPRMLSANVMQAMTRQLERAQQTQPPTLPSPPRHRLNAWWLASVVIILASGLAGYTAAHWWIRPPALVAAPPVRSLSLNVSWSGSLLHLHWDRNAPVIRNASRGVLSIGDGAERRQIELNEMDLKDGRIAYWPASTEVDFKLEVRAGSVSASESLRAVSLPQPALAPPPTLTPERPARPVQSPLPSRSIARVDLETWKSSGNSPPRPLHSEIPTITGPLRSRLKDDVAIDVRVNVNASGKVMSAGLLTRPTAENQAFRAPALDASCRWTFIPARKGQHQVPSTWILHYRFGHPVRVSASLEKRNSATDEHR